MRILKCVDCGNEFSNKNIVCPNCYCLKDKIIYLEKLEKEKRTYSYETIYLMLKSVIDFIKNNYKKYININLEIKKAGITNPINFAEVNNEIKKLLKDARTKMHFLLNSFDDKNQFPKKDIYIAYMKSLESYIQLLELDYTMNHKLCDKSKGGKYNYFEYRKDSKIRNEKCNETIALIERLKKIFSMKQPSKNTYFMIEACIHLVFILKEKYFKEIINNKEEYKPFREELCAFHDHVIFLPIDEDNKAFRRDVLFAIENFIELIEYWEEKNPNLNKIKSQEEDLLIELDKIKEKLYEIQV